MEDSTIAIRLKALIETLGLSDSQFADRCSISRPTLSLLLSGKNKKISDVQLGQIHNAFPEVSILWILFGEGSMFAGMASNNQEEAEISNENQKFPNNGSEEDEQLNLVNLKQLENIIQNIVNKSFESSFVNIENSIQKINLKPNPRKVRTITVYYDDSTFETFIPEKA